MGRITILTMLLAFFVISLTFIPSISGEEEEEDIHCESSIAILDTDFGIIKFVLYENWTPITSSHFIELAEAGHYDGVLFHRIVDDFVIQTGDGGGSDTIPLEIHPNAT
ncbi:MAG: peptidylprolyl isomerase, partial [Thermoplasmata archaeon]